MVNKIIKNSKKIFSSPQTSVLSAASVIMFMIVASQVLGLVRQITLAHFFTAQELSLFFASFRLPDLIFEVLVFGTFSSAFIPVFAKSLKKSRKEAWEIAVTITNLGILAFILIGIVIFGFATHLYGFLAPGFDETYRDQIVLISRTLFAAQGFFVVSYVLTAVLESSRRFLVPAIAPLFYNLGIILGTHLLSDKYGLMGPTIGVVVGAALHFLVQLPLALKLGFRFRPRIKITKDVKKIGRLALPKLIEVSFTQVVKSVELLLASLISTASYTYFTLGNTIQLLPVRLFGTSIAKAALPTLTRQSDNPVEFKRTLFGALYQVAFLILPMSAALIVLRIPVVRLVFGTDLFSWADTVQTGMVVSAFSLSIFFQAANSLLSRGFYALHDTKTPVTITLSTIIFDIVLAFLFIKVLHLPVWGLAIAFSISSMIQAFALLIHLNRKLKDGSLLTNLSPIGKSIVASFGSGFVMYFLLKFFDKSVWIKRLSFLGRVDINLPFEKFVLDTRYSTNLLILTVFVLLIGAVTYFMLSFLFRSEELRYFLSIVKKTILRRKVEPISVKESEMVTPLDNT